MWLVGWFVSWSVQLMTAMTQVHMKEIIINKVKYPTQV
jgi:hypothetical protein